MNAVRSTFFVSTICGLMLVLLAVIGAVQAWLHVDHAAVARRAEAAQAADFMRTRAERALQGGLAPLRALAAYVESQRRIDRAELAAFAAGLARPGSGTVLLMPDGRIDDLLVGPAPAARSLLHDPDQAIVITQALISRRMVVSDPILIEGRRMLAAYNPIFVERDGTSRYWGLAAVLLDLESIIDEIAPGPGAPGQDYTIRSVGRDVTPRPLIAGDPGPSDPEGAARIASFPGGAWEIAVAPPPPPSVAGTLLRGAGPAGIGALLMLALIVVHARARGQHQAAMTDIRLNADHATVGLDEAERFIARRLAIHGEAGGRTEMRLADGRRVMVTEHRTPDGGVVSIRTDITELKQRSLEIEAQQILLRSTLESLDDGVAVFDDEGMLTLWNSRFPSLADIDPVCMERGIGLAALLAVQRRNGIFAAEDIEFAAGRDHLADTRLSLGQRRTRSGRTLRLELSWTVGGHTVLTLVDQTDAAQAAEILAASERRLRDILEVSPIGIAVFDRDGRPLFSNDRHCEMLGLQRSEMGNYTAGTAFVDPADRQAVLSALRDHGVMPQRDFLMRCPDGTRRWVSMSARNLIFDGCPATICHLFDVTALKEPEALRGLPAPLDGLAHEIELPLRCIAENLRYLQTIVGDLVGLAGQAQRPDADVLADEVPAAIEQSLEEVERIAQLAQAMGDVAVPGPAGGAPFDLNRAIRAALAVTAHHWRQAADVDLDLDDRLPLLRGDLGDLHQMLIAAITCTAQAIERRRSPAREQIRISTRITGNAIEMTIADSAGALQGWDAIVRSAALQRLRGQVEIDAAAGAALRLLLPLQEVSALAAA